MHYALIISDKKAKWKPPLRQDPQCIIKALSVRMVALHTPGAVGHTCSFLLLSTDGFQYVVLV